MVRVLILGIQPKSQWLVPYAADPIHGLRDPLTELHRDLARVFGGGAAGSSVSEVPVEYVVDESVKQFNQDRLS